MSYVDTITESRTFTETHARHMAAKVAADLKRIQRLYEGKPSDLAIANYEQELILLLKAGYLDEITYGYPRRQVDRADCALQGEGFVGRRRE